MRTHLLAVPLAVTLIALTTVASAWAQAAAPAPEPKVWTVNASAGLALTSGNTDTSTVNMAYDLIYDPQTKNLVKSDALYIHSTSEGDLTASRLGFNVRDEYKLKPRIFLFAQNQYLRDEFKNIDWLLAPGGGIGVKLFDTMDTKLSVDGGVGGVWEANTGLGVRSSGAVTSSEALTQRITATTTITQSVTALWKAQDWNDSLYTFGAGIAASVSTRTQLKLEVLDVFKNLPPSPEIKKNDVAVLMSIVYKI